MERDPLTLAGRLPATEPERGTVVLRPLGHYGTHLLTKRSEFKTAAAVYAAATHGTFGTPTPALPL